MELRAVLVGLGMMGRNHARVMSSTDQVTLVGIADPIGDPAGNIDHSLLVESVPELIGDRNRPCCGCMSDKRA